MKKILLPVLLLSVVFSNCSTAYKTGSTPDDVYYSPGTKAAITENDRYEDYTSAGEENYLRMKVHNRYQWDAIDDYSYWNDSRYDFGYSCFPSRQVMLNPYNPYSAWSFGLYYSPWSSFYNPYYTIVYYKSPRAYYGSTGKANLSAYRNGNYYYNNNANKQSFGSLLKSAFSNNNNSNYNYNNTDNNPTRSFNSSYTPSNNAGGRSGGFNSSSSSGGTRPSRPPMT